MRLDGSIKQVGKTNVFLSFSAFLYPAFLYLLVVKILNLYLSSCKDLGFHILSDKSFKFSYHEDLCSFFGSANSILNCLSSPKENVQLQLLYSNCVPRLTYGADVKDPNAGEKQQLNVAVNNAIRRIFHFQRWESIRHLREFYKFESIEVMFAKAKRRFEVSIANHGNRV